MEIVKKEIKNKNNPENIQEIKEKYEKLSEKYKLPDFDILREDFDMDKFLDKKTDYLIRDIRRAISEKVSAYLHLFETLVNPSSPPIFVFSFLKNLDLEQKKEIKEIYKKLTVFQIRAMKLDTIYSEKSEAEFISELVENWIDLKKKIYKIVEKFEKDFLSDSEIKEKSYFG